MTGGVKALLQGLEITLGVRSPGQLGVAELLDLLAKRGLTAAEVFAGIEARLGRAESEPSRVEVKPLVN